MKEQMIAGVYETNPLPTELICPFCKVPLKESLRGQWDCEQCKAYSMFNPTIWTVEFVGEDGVWGVKSSTTGLIFAWFISEEMAREYIRKSKKNFQERESTLCELLAYIHPDSRAGCVIKEKLKELRAGEPC